MSDYPGAIDYFVDSSRVFAGQNSCETIVIHGTGGDPNQSAQALGDYFRSTPLRTSVHYGIDRQGVVAQYVREQDGAGGNCCVEGGYDAFWQQYLNKYGNLNLCSISIEHENDATNSLPLTDAQKQASFKLIAYLSNKYGIAPDHIKSHGSIAPQSRSRCPGNYPWDELFAFLQGGSMGIPQGWKDDGHTLTAPNNIDVVLGFRDWILSHNWDAGNIPLTPEYHADPVQLHNTGLGGGQRQIFRDDLLWYTPEHGVVQEPFLGMELFAAYNAAMQPLKTQQPNVTQAISDLAVVSAAFNKVLQDLKQQ